ncbi:Hypothetical predicted protein [Cloeon dipterum]|uniref:TTF-type domain-containing protein n=1 Tax=Cloeon dipterum TaxID=197152 RepID=A0A8S1CN48_9INSE|nr:Hypothetical predicted protein [Cloeon dipterum]
MNASWPTDKCNFTCPGTSLNAETKSFILSGPLCQPRGDFDQVNGFRFNPSLYRKVSPSATGIAVHRYWLQYSNKTNEAYCLPCWLFGPPIQENIAASSPWQTGFQSFKHTKQAVERHEASKNHIISTQCMKHFKSGQGIDKALAEEREEEEKFWRKVIKRVIDVVIHLATQNLPLRGHREALRSEEINATNRGNFIATIELLAKYDTVLNELLKTGKGKPKYLSKTVQNEVISCISAILKEQIGKEVQAAPYYSVIFDTTQDISKVDQGSLIFRYLDFKKDELGATVSFQICETFVGFVEVRDSSAASIFDLLVKELCGFGLTNFDKLRGMGFDGAAVMKGQYNGVQAKIKEKQPSAMYVHCLAHNLNLVVRAVVKTIKELFDFFHFVEELYAFFAKSLPRWQALDDKFHEKSIPNEGIDEAREIVTDDDEMELEEGCDSNSESGSAVEQISSPPPPTASSAGESEVPATQTESNETPLKEAGDTIEGPPPAGRRQRVALKKLCATSTEDHKADVRSRAQSLYNFFSKLESIAILCLEFEKLRILRKCSKTFQRKNIELSEADYAKYLEKTAATTACAQRLFGQRAFSFRVVSPWNNLPPELKDCSVSEFPSLSKKHLWQAQQ